jgi:hypothetical protein
MKELKMQDYGLMPLTRSDKNEITGGVLPWWMPQAFAIGLVISFVNNFGDVVDGWNDGATGKPRYSH